MTFEQWAAGVRERLSKATPGPWWFHKEPIPDNAPEFHVPWMEVRYGDPTDDSDSFDLMDSYRESDYRLIAHAPRDLATALEVIGVMKEAMERCACLCDDDDATQEEMTVVMWLNKALASLDRLVQG